MRERDVSFGGIVLRDGYHHHIIIIIPVHSLENRTQQHNQTTNNTKKYEKIYIYTTYVCICNNIEIQGKANKQGIPYINNTQKN